MKSTTRGTFPLAQSVVEDTFAYRREVERFLAGELSSVAFRAIRVPMGIYEQRDSGRYMVRVRGAGGLYFVRQLEHIANLADRFGSGIVHITARQDIQIHDVPVEHTPNVLESLLDAGLSPRGGGGNTVRNVTACPLSGICPAEVFDVTGYSLALTEYLLRDRSSFNLPRKFKVAFSGCARDCALGSVFDLVFFAKIKDGVHGFHVKAGGGMGIYSALAVEIEDFIPASNVFVVAEAVKRLFDKHGDRSNKHRARLRFVLDRIGPEEFRRMYLEEKAAVAHEDLDPPAIPEPFWAEGEASERADPFDESVGLRPGVSAVEQKQGGRLAVRINVPLGVLQARELSELAKLAASFGDGIVRGTQEQDLLIQGVQVGDAEELLRRAGEINPAFGEAPPIGMLVCAGAATCKLGLCLSRGLASAIEDAIPPGTSVDSLTMRISGCPNACAQHPVAGLGLYGRARRIDGRMMPYYAVVAGGRVCEDAPALAREIGLVPAKAVPKLLSDFLTAASNQRRPGESFLELLDRWGYRALEEMIARVSQGPSYDDAPDYYRDFGSDEDFSLAGRGPGECGAGVLDVVALDLDQARNSLGAAKSSSDRDSRSQSLYAAAVAACRALLITRGIEPRTDNETFRQFDEHLIRPGWVAPDVRELVDAAIEYRMGDRQDLSDLRDRIDALATRVKELFLSLDAHLNFRAPKAADVEESGLETQESGPQVKHVDLRGVACPMNFVRAKLELEQVEVGGVLEVLLDDGEPVQNVPASFADQGQDVLAVEPAGEHFRVRIRRAS